MTEHFLTDFLEFKISFRVQCNNWKIAKLFILQNKFLIRKVIRNFAFKNAITEILTGKKYRHILLIPKKMSSSTLHSHSSDPILSPKTQPPSVINKMFEFIVLLPHPKFVSRDIFFSIHTSK